MCKVVMIEPYSRDRCTAIPGRWGFSLAASTQGGRLARAVEVICAEHDTDRELRGAIVDVLRGAIDFAWYAFLLTDPVTEVGSSPVAEAPSVSDLPRLIRAKYLTEVNRWTSMAAHVESLWRATAGNLDQSLMWREVLSDYGVVDVASLVFRDDRGCWAWLDLWRTNGAPFSEDELEVLTGITAPVTTAIRRTQALTFVSDARTTPRGGPAVLVLSPALEVTAQTPDTERYLSGLVPPGRGHSPVPAGAYNVAAQLLALEAGIDGHSAVARLHLQGGLWLAFRAARAGAAAGADAKIAVTIEPATPRERREVFARSHDLTPREMELLEQLAQGADTRLIAASLHLSEHTVQDHFKSIFAKTGTNNRRTLLTRISGS